MNNEIIRLFPDIDNVELAYLQQATAQFDDKQLSLFASIYRSKRKEPQLILLTCLLGLVGFAGIHRLLTGQVGLGIIYFLTGGLCLIGTIVDMLNHKTLALKYNEKMMEETLRRIY